MVLISKYTKSSVQHLHHPSSVAVMAVALSFATYIYNSYLRHGSTGTDPIVQTTTGLLQGNVAVSRDGRQYFEFLGVPYAQQPIGDLRFERPLPVEPWKGIRMAKNFGHVCMQLEVMVTARVLGDESCLFLNIFTPQVHDARQLSTSGGGGSKSAKRLATLVFLHGGLFMSGSSNMYRGKYFMDEDVILVTLNYRLSALGFLNTGDGYIRGNMGLWDQNQAFRWLKNNIEQFGGDPENLVIFGESAGASSVHYHMLSPYSAGLMSKAVSQSGTALQIWALSKHPEKQSRNLARAMKCPLHNSTIMISCLRAVDARKLVQYHISSMSAIRENTDLFVPTVDGDFIPGNPMDLLRNGSFAKIPWMTGINAGEGLLNTGRILASRKITENIWQNWNKWIPLMLDYDPKRYDISWKIKQYYFSQLADKPIGDEAIANFTAMYSDRVYFLDSKKAAMLHAKHAPVYLYYYSYPGEVSFFRLFKAVMPSLGDIMAPELKIAMDVTKDFIRKYLLRQPMKYLDIPCHADELILQFNTHRLIEINKNSRDYPVSKALVKSWADFANSNWTLTHQNSQWPPVSLTNSGKLNYMQININGHMIPEPFTESTRFWESMGF